MKINEYQEAALQIILIFILAAIGLMTLVCGLTWLLWTYVF